MNTSIFGPEKDKLYMSQALALAKRAFDQDEVPVGAVLVNPQGAVISTGFNQVEQLYTQCAHAEMIAIQQAQKHIGDWRLDGHWLFVTLEPCLMCMGLIDLSRLQGIVYGASSPLFGYRLDKNCTSRVYQKEGFSVVSGVLAQESAGILKHFFKNKRESKRD